MVSKSFSGASYLFRGFALLLQPGIRRYIVIPLALNVSLFGVGIWYAYGWLQAWLTWMDTLLPSWLLWLQWIFVPLLVLAVAIAVFFSFSVFANLIAAPFNGLLAEQIEYQLTGHLPEGGAMDWGELLAKTLPLVWNEINKTLYALLWAIPCLILFFVPVIQIAAPFLWVAYSSWMLAIQYLDIPMGNHGITGKQLRRVARQERFLSLGFGFMVLLMTTVPFVNFFAMPAAVAGGTILWVEQFLPEKNRILAD